MRTVAITGASSRFARVLLPLLEADPDIERIVGIDLVPPVGTYNKLTFQMKSGSMVCNLPFLNYSFHAYVHVS